MRQEQRFGIIGGSGFYQMEGLDRVEQVDLKTPFGRPRICIYRGRIGEVEMVFLARHGRGHRLMPERDQLRANIYGMKQLGVESHGFGQHRRQHEGGTRARRSGGARPVHRSRLIKRPATFFGDGIVVHVSLADPVCAALARSSWSPRGEGGARGFIRAEPICASRGRSSPPAPSRTCIEAGAWT